jgi:hypothetical protein
MSKILHVGGGSGVPSILKKYQIQHGHEVNLLIRCGNEWNRDMIIDNMMSYYNEKCIRRTDVIRNFGFWNARYFSTPYNATTHMPTHYKKTIVKKTYLRLFNISKTSKIYFFVRSYNDIVAKYAKFYDIIHIHGDKNTIPHIKEANPKAKIIMHYHGDDLRLHKSRFVKYEKDVDMTLVSTKDLLDYGDNYTWLPNPVDTELFAKKNIKKNNKISCIKVRDENRDRLREILEDKFDMQVVIKNDSISYASMPDFFAENEYYADIRIFDGVNPNPAYSTTGLQALAIGNKVINYNLDIDQGLPDVHKPENVIKQLDKLYGCK